MIGQCVYDRQARRVKALIPLGPAGICVIVQGSAKTLYIYTVYDRIFGDFPAKNTVHTPYIYMALANPSDRARVGQNPHTVRRIRKRWGNFKYGGWLYGVFWYFRTIWSDPKHDWPCMFDTPLPCTLWAAHGVGHMCVFAHCL